MKACICAFSRKKKRCFYTISLRELADQGLAWELQYLSCPKPQYRHTHM